MIYKNGIYLSLRGESAIRTITENGAKVCTDVIKIADSTSTRLGWIERVL